MFEVGADHNFAIGMRPLWWFLLVGIYRTRGSAGVRTTSSYLMISNHLQTTTIHGTILLVVVALV